MTLTRIRFENQADAERFDELCFAEFMYDFETNTFKPPYIGGTNYTTIQSHPNPEILEKVAALDAAQWDEVQNFALSNAEIETLISTLMTNEQYWNEGWEVVE